MVDSTMQRFEKTYMFCVRPHVMNTELFAISFGKKSCALTIDGSTKMLVSQMTLQVAGGSARMQSIPRNRSASTPSRFPRLKVKRQTAATKPPYHLRQSLQHLDHQASINNNTLGKMPIDAHCHLDDIHRGEGSAMMRCREMPLPSTRSLRLRRAK